MNTMKRVLLLGTVIAFVGSVYAATNFETVLKKEDIGELKMLALWFLANFADLQVKAGQCKGNIAAITRDMIRDEIAQLKYKNASKAIEDIMQQLVMKGVSKKEFYDDTINNFNMLMGYYKQLYMKLEKVGAKKLGENYLDQVNPVRFALPKYSELM